MKKLLALCPLCLVPLGLAAAPASAHGDEGVITVVEAEPVSNLELEVRYVVRLAYANDGDTVPDATVSAVREASDALLTLTPLGDGLYEGTYVFPAAGSFEVRFTAVTPTATLVHTQVIAAPTTTTAEPTTTTTPSTTTFTTEAAAAAPASRGGGDGAGGGIGPAVVVPAVLLTAAVVGAGLWATRRRRLAA